METGRSAETGSACESFNACGGSLLGAWKLPGTVVCEALATCDGYDRVDQAEAHGSITFGAYSTFQWISTLAGTRSTSYPSWCPVCSSKASNANGVSASCSQSAPGSCRCDYVYD
jgi:hypothetical protein